MTSAIQANSIGRAKNTRFFSIAASAIGPN
jgi:hypothetical protein